MYGREATRRNADASGRAKYRRPGCIGWTISDRGLAPGGVVMFKLIATLPPVDSHNSEIAAHPMVSELRYNVSMPGKGTKREVLQGLLKLAGRKPLHLDVKARQLRIKKSADTWYGHIELNHAIRVNTPTKAIFKSGALYSGTIKSVEGNKIFLEEVPRWPLLENQPVNIPDPSLEIEGCLTDACREWLEAAKATGVERVMLSFTEQIGDLEEVWAIHPRAQIIAKIESLKGLAFVSGDYAKVADRVRLMAARDDLLMEIGVRKTDMFDAEKLILAADPNAVVASRILTSLEKEPDVSLGDLKDLHHLMSCGWKRALLSDGVCKKADVFRRAMVVLDQFRDYWERTNP